MIKIILNNQCKCIHDLKPGTRFKIKGKEYLKLRSYSDLDYHVVEIASGELWRLDYHVVEVDAPPTEPYKDLAVGDWFVWCSKVYGKYSQLTAFDLEKGGIIDVDCNINVRKVNLKVEVDYD